MKTILAPVDYSKVSLNALRYAADMAVLAKAKLVLLHIYEIPLPTAEAPAMVIAPEVLERENLKRINSLKKDVEKRAKDAIIVEAIVHSGFADTQILRTAKEKKADLVVVGTTGAGALMQTFAGSTTLSLLKKLQVPVMVIPEKARFSKANKIVYACDFEQIKDHAPLELMKELAKLFGSEVMVLNVNRGSVVPAINSASEGIELERWFSDVKHSYWYSEENDIIDAVNDFVEKRNAKIIAMFARRHFFPDNILHKSVTKRMALRTHVPFLSMHEAD